MFYLIGVLGEGASADQCEVKPKQVIEGHCFGRDSNNSGGVDANIGWEGMLRYQVDAIHRLMFRALAPA